jgi:hypothetical protein
MSAKSTKSEPVKTILIIVLGFMIIYLITKSQVWLNIALILGLTGFLSGYLAKKIDFIWMKLAWILGLIIPNILLSVIFYLFLTPLALLSRIGKSKNLLMIKNNRSTLFKEHIREFDKVSFEKPW